MQSAKRSKNVWRQRVSCGLLSFLGTRFAYRTCELSTELNLLVSNTRIIGLLVTEGSHPSFLTLAGEARVTAGPAHAMGTHLLVAWLTAGQDACLHGHFSEVLQFTVDVKVPDAAVEAGPILARGLAQGCHIAFPGYSWGSIPHGRSGSLCAPQAFVIKKC